MKVETELNQTLFGTVDKHTLQKFKAYHLDRPEILELFTEYAKMMHQTGRNHYSAKCIIERIRWDQDLRYPDTKFKISNSFTSLYVRLFIYLNPEFIDFFQLKPVRGLRNPDFEKEDAAEELRLH